ncbi:unnamed protein product [Heligmosomoides polygyrus]|uniref:Protein kinase domain-containing protein n=1 Tax=Heligmosomoides polygyrus TaxID=6339 RepID=A0A3P7ZPS6_HELPZ|nr:unnamed protein product [Heligmosomoides polygyrus]
MSQKRFSIFLVFIYLLQDLIGTGNFCSVYKGVYERDANDEIVVAIKICHGAAKDTMTEESKKARESMMHEAYLMSYYVHKHVIQLYGVACDHYPVMIVMEFCPGGNLQDHLQKYKDQIEVPELVAYASESARGMRYLHSKSCVHRDLAARNCLISDTGLIKISDFGLSKIAEDLGGKGAGSETEGEPPLEQIPLRWMAPECLRRPQLWSLKSDIWSYGVLLYEIFNEGQKPWPNDPPKKIATMIRKGKMPDFPAKTPAPIKEFVVTKIWSLNPEQRPTMDEIAKKISALKKDSFKMADPSKAIIKRILVSKSKSETVANDADVLNATVCAGRTLTALRTMMRFFLTASHMLSNTGANVGRQRITSGFIRRALVDFRRRQGFY